MFFTVLVLAVAVLFYWYATKNFNYWKKKGVKHDPPLPLVGNNLAGYLMQKGMPKIYDDLYNRYPNEKVVGFYQSSNPQLVLRDPELVKQVLQTDFNHFYKRGLFPANSDEPLEKHLFNLEGDLWRLLRHRMTPAFTTAKLKAMFPLIVERAEQLQTRLAKQHGQTIDARELMARFTTDFVGACGFGIDSKSLDVEESEFRKLGKRIFTIRPIDAITFFLKKIFPSLLKNLKTSQRFESDLMQMINSVLAARNHAPSGRNDFIDQMLECKSKGLMVGDSLEHFKPDGTPETVSAELTDDLIAAQAFVFFAAGFETSSSSTSITLHQLAYHPEVQKKLHDHIDAVLAKHDNKLSYDSIKDMHYLEWAFKEGMRLLPGVGFLIRECAKEYTFEDIGLTIEEGTPVIVPVQALQHDPQYWDCPQEFRPERFDPKSLDAEKTKYVYLPFGEGPRNCIGSRLGLMQSLAGLAAVLSKFSVEPAPTSVRHPVISGKPAVVQLIEAGLPLVFKERKKTL